MHTAQPHQINLFLILFKDLATKKFVFVQRDKSLDSIAQLGITVKQAKAEIMTLTFRDYHRGPDPDSTRKDEEFWEFGKLVQGVEFFIRLKAVPKLKMAKCHSFHPCEKQMTYPYKGGTTL